jgi:hypothetical protein
VRTGAKLGLSGWLSLNFARLSMPCPVSLWRGVTQPCSRVLLLLCLRRSPQAANVELLTFAANRQVYPPVFTAALSAITDTAGVAIIAAEASSWSGAVVARDLANGDMAFWYYVPLAGALPDPEVVGKMITDRAVYKPGVCLHHWSAVQ